MGLAGLPLLARGPVSTSLGAADPAYRISADHGGFSAVSPAQRLGLRFDRAGVLLSAGTARLALGLRAIGYGGSSPKALGEVAPLMNANRVVYPHPWVSEWYTNGPLGLEQGFTVSAAPAGPRTGPLTLAISLAGNLRARLSGNRRSLALTRADRDVLRYVGLTATDAGGHVLRSWLQLGARAILLRVDSTGARYPLRIDPFIQQGEKLEAEGEVGEGEFGYSVALSGNGDTALVGGRFDDERAGAAWVFTRSGSTWTEQGEKLTPTGESPIGLFGASVALSADGDTALIGAPGDAEERGAAWVFTRSGETWIQQGRSLAGGEEENGTGYFGASVALSAEGDIAVVGGDRDDDGVGAAWVFRRADESWTGGEKLTAELMTEGEESEGVASGGFGSSVALSASGDTVLIGGPESGEVGAAWVFTRSSEEWIQQGEALVSLEEGAAVGGFGSSVALSAEGDTALVGGPESGGTGAAWVFARSGETWTQQGGKLTGGEEVGSGGLFGASVALSLDGHTALIGAPGAAEARGAVWVFARSGEHWAQQGGALTGGEEEIGSGEFGSSVALSSEGDTALIGGPGENGAMGAAWVFAFQPPTPPVNTSSPAISGSELPGSTLTCSAGSWTGVPPPSFTYQWLRDGVAIAGATAPSYLVQSADEGHTLSCQVTAANTAGQQAALSAGVTVPAQSVLGSKESHEPEALAPGPGKPLEALTLPEPLERPAPLPAPISGHTANLTPVSGTVLIKLPGELSFAPLDLAGTVPIGTIVNATSGRVALCTADAKPGSEECAEFYGGELQVEQRPGEPHSHVVLVGGDFAGCPASRRGAARASAASREPTKGKPERSLWGSDRGGKHITDGRNSATITEATIWLVRDTCFYTLTTVAQGVVSVYDYRLHRRFVVRAGHSYIARAR